MTRFAVVLFGMALVLAAPTVLAPLVDRANTADRVHQASGLDPLHWTGPAPDIAVNLHGRGPQSHRLLLDTAPGRLAAFSCPDAGVDGPEWTAEEHEVDRWCRLVSRTLDTAVDPHDIELAASSDPPRVSEAVVVHPGAA